MSANSFDAVAFIRELKSIPGKVTLWQELEDLKDDLGHGITIEAEASELTFPFSFLKFLIVNQERIKSLNTEEKTLTIELSERELKLATSLDQPFMLRISCGVMQLFAELEIYVNVYCQPDHLIETIG
jgi:hypothetical protein